MDSLNVNILKEMIADPNVRSADIAAKYDRPLSTVQRRRMQLEKKVLKKTYNINFRQLGWRTADLLIHVKNGNCEQVAETVLSKYRDFIASTSLRIGSPEINVMAHAFYLDSQDLYNLVENIKSIPEVTEVEWSEVVKVLDSNNTSIIDAVFGKAI
jgi:DNA-binding Lrp family transcriptional regulator